MGLVKWIDFDIHGDERGQLVSLEENKNIPFDVRRIYYLYGTKDNVSRGFHAHKELRQIAVCVAGKCLMKLDDGINKEEVWLNSPARGLLIDKMVWHEMHHFSDDCVLMVVADDYYDETDYVRDYADFTAKVNN